MASLPLTLLVRAKRVVALLVVKAERIAVVVEAMRVMVVGGTAVRGHVKVPHAV